MKKLTILIFLSAFFYSCMPPVVNRMIMKTYPQKDSATTVKVYFDKSELPSSSESLGIVSVYDGGASIHCDSVAVVNIIKDEVYRAGGNAAYVSEHIRPSFWGSTCHQMTATLLRINNYLQQDTMAAVSDLYKLPDVRRIKLERKLPSMNVDVKMGYGFRTAKISEDLDEFQRYFLEKRKSGLSFGASYQYFFNDWNGIGLMYSGYFTHVAVPAAYETDNGTVTGILTARDEIKFIAPMYVYRLTPSEKLFINMAVAMGYVSYIAKENFSADYYYTAQGGTLGLNYGAEMEYKFSQKTLLYC
ncbi:MAG: hypothetical protein VB102_05135 [Paludibacter sp.]|nr:hypothetical protein [Paludibacter sp.]